MREKKSIPITIFTKRICIEYCFATKIIHLKLANEAQFPTLYIRGSSNHGIRFMPRTKQNIHIAPFIFYAASSNVSIQYASRLTIDFF